MLRAAWGEGQRGAVRRIAADRALKIVEHGPLAIAGDVLDVAGAGDILCVFVGRLPGIEPGKCAEHVLDRYARHGLAVLAQLHGAYTTFISDGTRAWAARDRLGAFTLSYKSDDGDVAIGEHEADVLELLLTTPAPDRMAVVQWLDRRTLPQGRSLFAGLRRLRTGHLLELTGRGAITREYWQPTYRGVDRGSREDLADALRDETFGAIARAGAGASTVGLRLSGGLDSACLAAGLAHCGEPSVQALAATFPLDPEADESALIAATARFSGLSLTTVPFRGGDVLGPALRHLRRWRVPPWSANLLVWEPLWAVARDLGVDVLLDGEGGDETFGAAKYLISDRLRAGRPGQAWRLSGSLPAMGVPMPWRTQVRVFRAVGLSGALPPRLQAARRRRRPQEHLVSRLVRPADVPSLVDQDDPWSFKRRPGPVWWRDVVATSMDVKDALDVNGFFRRQAADAGFDQRHPFLHDVGLLERILQTPPGATFDVTRDRALLRDALVGYVAEEIRTRHTKSHFTTISLSRMLGEDGERLATALRRPDAPVREYVDGRGLEMLVNPWPPDARAATARSIQLLSVGLINLWLLLLGDDADAGKIRP